MTHDKMCYFHTTGRLLFNNIHPYISISPADARHLFELKGSDSCYSLAGGLVRFRTPRVCERLDCLCERVIRTCGCSHHAEHGGVKEFNKDQTHLHHHKKPGRSQQTQQLWTRPRDLAANYTNFQSLYSNVHFHSAEHHRHRVVLSNGNLRWLS